MDNVKKFLEESHTKYASKKDHMELKARLLSHQEDRNSLGDV